MFYFRYFTVLRYNSLQTKMSSRSTIKTMLKIDQICLIKNDRDTSLLAVKNDRVAISTSKLLYYVIILAQTKISSRSTIKTMLKITEKNNWPILVKKWPRYFATRGQKWALQQTSKEMSSRSNVDFLLTFNFSSLAKGTKA